MTTINNNNLNGGDFMSSYFNYIGETESPIFYHRWCAISLLATMLGRDFSFNHGHFNINPNMYLMLMGVAATRKSTAIKLAVQLMRHMGYANFSADRTSKEKWLLDLAAQHGNGADDNGKDIAPTNLADINIFGDDEDEASLLSKPPIECAIMADEFNDFLGNGNVEFISMLGVLWDYHGVYKNRIKTGKSVNLPNPTINILSGNTPTGFAAAFPPEIIGQGFFSRLVLVYGEPTGKKITFPTGVSTEAISNMIKMIAAIKKQCRGVAVTTPEARSLLDKIYTGYKGIDDVRFESYSNRRFTHLLKLCLTTAASEISNTITAQHVLLANTILTHTEHGMPKALGEFGKAKNSGVINILMDILNKTKLPIDHTKLYSMVRLDVNSQNEFTEILRNLTIAGKIQYIRGSHVGYLPKRIVVEVDESQRDVVDFNLLTSDEREGR